MSTALEIKEASRRLSAADRPGTIGSFFPYWDSQIRPFLLNAIAALPDDRFDFKPRPEMFTAHQVALHVAEAERGWIHHVLEGGPYEEWILEHENPSLGWVTAHGGHDRASLLSALAEWHAHTRRWFDQPAAELGTLVHYQPQDGSAQRHYTVHYILARVQEHEIHHRAQLVLYLRLMGIQPPPIM
ncbi:MAG TPA: DinB family protein [Terriglobales bacterium]|nr:DinB family protein [Terriglobales bacterium]